MPYKGVRIQFSIQTPILVCTTLTPSDSIQGGRGDAIRLSEMGLHDQSGIALVIALITVLLSDYFHSDVVLQHGPRT